MKIEFTEYQVMPADSKTLIQTMYLPYKLTGTPEEIKAAIELLDMEIERHNGQFILMDNLDPIGALKEQKELKKAEME